VVDFHPLKAVHSPGAQLADRYFGHLWGANLADNDIGGLSNEQLVEMYLRAAGVAVWVGTMALSPARDVLLGVEILTAQDTVGQVSEAVLREALSREEEMQPPVGEFMKLVLDVYPRLDDPALLEKSGFVVPPHLGVA